MIITVELDPTEGRHAYGHVIGVILAAFERDPAGVFEVKTALEQAIERLPESLDGFRVVRLEPKAGKED